ncbi:MAG TPA: cytochrome c [Hyphomonadaceae bacterium]|nr:cytochrome c [Hyphomonadaceae bacterium]
MKLTFVAVLGLGALAVAAPAVAGPTEGQALYETRCNVCHANAINDAPPIEKIRAEVADPAKVIEKLTTGTMTAMASGLSDQDKADIAAYLTAKPAGDAAAPAPAADAAPVAPAPQ